MVTLNEKEIVRAGIKIKLEELDRQGAFSSGERLHIERELLEKALFDYLYLPRAVMKVPVWSGDFLSKIDLSEVDFSHVAWSFFSKGKLYSYYMQNATFATYFNRVFEEGKQVIYRNTNAKIDFSNSFEALHSKAKRAIVENCDFSNTDLSNNNFSIFSYATSCGFAHTNIDFGDSFKSYYGGNTSFCSFKGNDLCGKQTSLLAFLLCIGGCEENDFSDTGLNFCFSKEEMKKLQNETASIYANKFLSCLKNGYLKGCYLNGVLLPTEKEGQEILVFNLFGRRPNLPEQEEDSKLTMKNPNMQ